MNGFGEEAQKKADRLIELGAQRCEPGFIDPASGEVAVCVVANALFEAVAVAYKPDEAAAFNRPDDDRPKTWLRLPTELVAQYSPLAEYLDE